MKRAAQLTAVILLSLISHIGLAQNNDKTALNKVKQLPEVKEFLRQTPKHQMPVIQLDNEPAKGNKYYVYSVGVSDNDMFRTSMRFYVEANTMQVYYCDWLSADQPLMTLKQWRYWRTRPEWNKNHTFKNGKLQVTKSN